MGAEAPPPIDGNLQRRSKTSNDPGFEKREMRPREPNRKPEFGRDLQRTAAQFRHHAMDHGWRRDLRQPNLRRFPSMDFYATFDGLATSF